MAGKTGGPFLPFISTKFRAPCGSSAPEDLSDANSVCEWLFDEKGKVLFYLNSFGSPGFNWLKLVIKTVQKTISTYSCTHLEGCINNIGRTSSFLNVYLSVKFEKVIMARGGFREGAGRKKEYNEPVKKILLGLPESVLKQLDSYATAKNLSRPKAVAILVEQAMQQGGQMVV